VEKISAISITIHDHDFLFTLQTLLESVQNALEHNPELTKEIITKSIYKGLEFHYLMFQLGNNYGKRGYGTVESIVNYLTENLQILFNQEAIKDTYIYSGCSLFLDINTKQITVY
jgi:hypothetical protein